MLTAAAHYGLVLPKPLSPSSVNPVPVCTGGDTAHLIYGKIQRHATLPGSRLSANPIAAVEDQGRLSKLLWSSFMMSSVPSADALDPSDIGTFKNSLMAMDTIKFPTTPGPCMHVAGGGQLTAFDEG